MKDETLYAIWAGVTAETNKRAACEFCHGRKCKAECVSVKTGKRK